MNPYYPYQYYYPSGTAQGAGYYPEASAAPASNDAGAAGGAYPAPHPGQQDSYGGQQTGYGGSHGGQQDGQSYQFVYYQQQPRAQQRTYGDDLEPDGFDRGPRPGEALTFIKTFSQDRPGHSQQHGRHPRGRSGRQVPPPRTSQNVPSVAAVHQPAHPGTSGGHGGQGPQASGHQARYGGGNEDVRATWSLREDWIFESGMMIADATTTYTEEEFRGDYAEYYGNTAESSGKDLMEEFRDLWVAYYRS